MNLRSPSTGLARALRSLSVLLPYITLGIFTSHLQAQLYIGESPASPPTGACFIGEYNASNGTAINTSFVTALTGHPTNLALFGNNLFVTNTNGTTIGEYDATTGATLNANFITGLTTPRGLLISGSTLFVASGSSTVGEYDATTGAAINASFISSGLVNPESFALSGNHLFVSSFGTGALGPGSVGEFDATSGAALNLSFITTANAAVGLALSGNDLFVVFGGTGGSKVAEYDATTGATLSATFISVGNPWGLAVSGNNLFVSGGTPTAGYVGEYNATSGAPINASFITGLNSAAGLAIAPAPEPGSAGLLIFGAGALLGWRRRGR